MAEYNVWYMTAGTRGGGISRRVAITQSLHETKDVVDPLRAGDGYVYVIRWEHGFAQFLWGCIDGFVSTRDLRNSVHDILRS